MLSHQRHLRGSSNDIDIGDGDQTAEAIHGELQH